MVTAGIFAQIWKCPILSQNLTYGQKFVNTQERAQENLGYSGDNLSR